MIGGNVKGLRPAYNAQDLTDFQTSLNYLSPGNWARCQTIFWEIFWNPDETKPNYAGLDKAIDLMIAAKVTPIFLLAACPHPSSAWYNNDHKDWWVPRRDTWPKIYQCLEAMVKHIISRYSVNANSRVFPNIFFQLHNEPAGRITNPPIGEKPGGSNKTEFGEWHPDLHEFLFGITQVLKKCNVPWSKTISPAISCIGEGNKREATEWLTCTPPIQFNWLSNCGYKAYHMRFGAGWAVDPRTRAVEVKKGFAWCADYLKFCNANNKGTLSAQKNILTEFYVSPGDCGCEIGEDINPYRQVALDEIKRLGYEAVVWGLLDGETDGPDNKWLTYGGWGKFLKTLNPTN